MENSSFSPYVIDSFSFSWNASLLEKYVHFSLKGSNKDHKVSTDAMVDNLQGHCRSPCRLCQGLEMRKIRIRFLFIRNAWYFFAEKGSLRNNTYFLEESVFNTHKNILDFILGSRLL